MHYSLPQPGKGMLIARQKSFSPHNGKRARRNRSEGNPFTSPEAHIFLGSGFQGPSFSDARPQQSPTVAPPAHPHPTSPRPHRSRAPAGKAAFLPADLVGARLSPPPTEAIFRISPVATADPPKGAQAWQWAPAAAQEARRGPALSHQPPWCGQAPHRRGPGRDLPGPRPHAGPQNSRSDRPRTRAAPRPPSPHSP